MEIASVLEKPNGDQPQFNWSKVGVAERIGVRVPEVEVSLDTEGLILYLAYLLQSPFRHKARTFITDQVRINISPSTPGQTLISSVQPLQPLPLSSPSSSVNHVITILPSCTTTPISQSTKLNYYQRAYLQACDSTATETSWQHALHGTDPTLSSDLQGKRVRPNTSILSKLGEMEKLSVLDVSDNFLGNAGSAALLRAIHSCEHLTTLVMRRNELQGEAISKLKQLMLASPSLTHIDISDNPLLGATAGEELLSGLKECPHILELNISASSIPTYLGEKIATILTRNASLHEVHL